MCGGTAPIDRSDVGLERARRGDASRAAAAAGDERRELRSDRMRLPCARQLRVRTSSIARFRGWPSGRPRTAAGSLLRGPGSRRPGVQRADAPDRRVEVLEQLAGDARGDLGAEAARQLILVRDDDAVGALDVRGDRVPVVRHDRAQVEHRDADAVLLGLLRRQQRPLHQRAPGDDDDVGRPRGAGCALPNGIMKSLPGYSPLL